MYLHTEEWEFQEVVNDPWGRKGVYFLAEHPGFEPDDETFHVSSKKMSRLVESLDRGDKVLISRENPYTEEVDELSVPHLEPRALLKRIQTLEEQIEALTGRLDFLTDYNESQSIRGIIAEMENNA